MRAVNLNLLLVFWLGMVLSSVAAQGPVEYGSGTAGHLGKIPKIAIDSDLYGGNQDFGLCIADARPAAAGLRWRSRAAR